MNRRLITAILALFAFTALLTACSSSPSTQRADRQVTEEQLSRYQQVQPVPQYDWSQYRQTLIDVLGAQVHGQATTTFFFNQGVDEPIFECPSIGFPVPSTAQLTNPQMTVWGDSGAVIPQAEPSGVYTGESTATYVVCVAPDGQAFVKYWEGFVDSVGAPALWDSAAKRIVIEGEPTVIANTR